MKRIVMIILLVTGMNSLGCNFIYQPDLLLERVIKKLKAEKRSDDIFCDSEELRMAYYLIDKEDYNLNLGISLKITEQTTNNQFKESFYNKFNEYKNFFQSIDKKNLGSLPLPDKEVLRFYARIENTDKFFVIGKYEYDRKSNKYTMYVNTTGRDLFEKIGLFTGMKIEYTDEVVF